MKEFLLVLLDLFIDMGFYLMLGLFIVGILNILINKEFIAKRLGKNSLGSIIKACLFGVPLPLCSCAVIPTAMYLKDKGASNAATTAFLVSTPQTGVDSIVATYGLMGGLFAIYRPIAAFLSGIISGLAVKIFGKNDAEADKKIEQLDIETTDCKGSCCSSTTKSEKSSFKDKIKSVLRYSYIDSISEISIHFIIGLIIAALITVLIPTDLIANLGLSSGVLAMIVMILIGMPMYICSTASIPIALTLMAKGISPGTAFVFLFMGPFTNAASLSIITKKLGKKTVLLYVFGAVISSILFGLLLDFITEYFGIEIITSLAGNMHHSTFSLFKTIVAGIFGLLLIYALYNKLVRVIKSKQNAEKAVYNKREYKVSGMTCDGCSNRLSEALLRQKTVSNAEVFHKSGDVIIYGDIKEEKIRELVENQGFKMKN